MFVKKIFREINIILRFFYINSDGWVAGMKQSARPDGCIFQNWGKQNPDSVWANTFHAHRLMYFVRQKYGWSKIHDFKKLLFQCYYEKGWNISNINVLIDVGILGGLDRTELEKFMNSEESINADSI